METCVQCTIEKNERAEERIRVHIADPQAKKRSLQVSVVLLVFLLHSVVLWIKSGEALFKSSASDSSHHVEFLYLTLSTGIFFGSVVVSMQYWLTKTVTTRKGDIIFTVPIGYTYNRARCVISSIEIYTGSLPEGWCSLKIIFTDQREEYFKFIRGEEIGRETFVALCETLLRYFDKTDIVLKDRGNLFPTFVQAFTLDGSVSSSNRGVCAAPLRP